MMTRTRAWLKVKIGWIPRPVRRIIVLVLGCTLLLLAVLGMVLPIMPGVVFIPLALGIMAMEFAWAARWLRKVRKAAQQVHDHVKRGIGSEDTAHEAETKRKHRRHERRKAAGEARRARRSATA